MVNMIEGIVTIQKCPNNKKEEILNFGGKLEKVQECSHSISKLKNVIVTVLFANNKFCRQILRFMKDKSVLNLEIYMKWIFLSSDFAWSKKYKEFVTKPKQFIPSYFRKTVQNYEITLYHYNSNHKYFWKQSIQTLGCRKIRIN